jgi:serine protease Do
MSHPEPAPGPVEPHPPTAIVAIAAVIAVAAFAYSANRPAAPALSPEDQALVEAEHLSQAFQMAAKTVRPSVLNITTERWIDADRNNPLVAFLGRVLEGRNPEDGRTQLERSFGTGFVVRDSGLALTNNHVVAGARRVTARLHDGREVKAEVIGTDPLSDLAILQLEAHPDGTPYVPVELGESDALEVGDWVLAVGNPFGLDQTVTAGVVSAKGRSRVGIAAYEDFIQTDAAINPGNSGGPLLDLRGRVVGIATAIASRNGRYQGIGFAIPTTMARKVMDDVVLHGRVVRGWLGVSVQNASPKLAKALGLGAQGGALVGGAIPGGPADSAGLRAGDLIVGVEGEAVGESNRLLHLVAVAELGQPLQLQVVRDGKTHNVEVIPTERPRKQAKPPTDPEATTPAEPARPNVGISARLLDARLARIFGFEKDAKGVVITTVERGSLAAEQGIRPGMILQEVDRRPIRTLDDLDAAVAAMNLEAGVLLRVWDGEFARFVLID